MPRPGKELVVRDIEQFMAWRKAHATIGETMIRCVNNRYSHQLGERVGLTLLVLLICCSLTAFAQSTVRGGETRTTFSIRATHLLGFESVRNNCGGTLSIDNDSLQFQQNGKTDEQVKIGSIRDVVLGEESKQVGGLPVILGKAAVPYGGGRALSLVTHKKFDTLTLEYLDDDGGVHGAVFQLQKGQAEAVKGQLVAQGVTISSRQAIAVVPGGHSASSVGRGTEGTRWSVQVNQVDPGSLDLPDSFQVAIFENLVEEVKKSNGFQQVLREGNHGAREVPNLLVLKITVESYTPGSETRRAVTTVSGATKLKVRSQLLTREGAVVQERTVDGGVRFFGNNLRATHNLARNIAKTIKESSRRDYSESTALLNADSARDTTRGERQ